jgi:hypothetical protein
VNDKYKTPKRVGRDLVGFAYGKLVVERMLGSLNNRVYWLCKCKCGNYAELSTNALNSGNTKSCGCLRDEKTRIGSTKHGLSSSRAYGAWARMMTRVYSEKSDHYHRYGGRGLLVESRFHDVTEFFNYMGDCPEGMTLERLDNDIGYVTGNMVWASSKVQSRNKSSNIFVEVDGREMVLSDAASELGIPRATLSARLSKGLTIEAAMSYPRGAKHVFLFNGVMTSLSALASSTGIKYKTLWNRVKVQGLSIDDAVLTGKG